MTSNAWLKRGHSRKGRCVVKLTEPEEIALGILAFEKGTTPADYVRQVLRRKARRRLPRLRSELAS